MLATINLARGFRTRVVIVWDTDTAYRRYRSRPSADLDLRIVGHGNAVVARSLSFDNTYEIIEFTPAAAGPYDIAVRKFRCDSDPKWLGWAWRQGD